MGDPGQLNRRTFLKASTLAGAGLVLGTPTAWARGQQNNPAKPKTNIADAFLAPKGNNALPGPFPGKVVEVFNPKAVSEGKIHKPTVSAMLETGIKSLTGQNMQAAFKRFFNSSDIVGLKVNPVGAGLISTRLEVVQGVIKWLSDNGLPKKQIVIWDRFDYMLTDAGFTSDNFPGVRIEGLQTMDEAAAEGRSDDNSHWLNADGSHRSAENFDRDQFYWADVQAPQEKAYLNQHVFNNKYSYFGKLVSRELTKIINLPALKNTGNGISVATKNLGYGAICNTGRLHRPLFFNVCTEVLAFPAIREKLALNITDGLIAQYDGGPGPNAQFVYENKRLYFATDPFASDMICHQQILSKRKEMGVKVNEHPRYTEYLRYAQKLGLGVADPAKIEHIRV